MITGENTHELNDLEGKIYGEIHTFSCLEGKQHAKTYIFSSLGCSIDGQRRVHEEKYAYTLHSPEDRIHEKMHILYGPQNLHQQGSNSS